MKKISIFIVMAVMAICMGHTTHAHKSSTCQCETATQYYFTGTKYVQAGVYGLDYECLAGAGICTYYLYDPMGHPGEYAPCHTGVYTPVP